jgi:ABC-2 type transport system permease protein
MNLRRVKAVAKKEFLHVFRDPRSLGLGIAIPMLLLFLFGYALTLDVDKVPLIVWDQSGTSASRDFISHFSGSHYFQVQKYTDNYREIERAIDRREARMALVIPSDFARRIESGGKARVQAILDGSDSNTATIVLGYADTVALTYSRGVMLEQARRYGMVNPTGQLDIRPRIWFNADMISRNYIFPGLIAVIMMVIAALLTSLTVAREWESGTMEQLISTPLKGPELIIGKLIPYFTIGLIDLILAILVGQFAFKVPLHGSITLLFWLSLLFITGTLSLGILISVVTKNQRVASQFALVSTMLPAFLLSGFIFPIDNMPILIRGFSHIIVARYFVTILRGIYLKDVGLGILGGEVLFLALFTVIMLAMAFRKIRKKII